MFRSFVVTGDVRREQHVGSVDLERRASIERSTGLLGVFLLVAGGIFAGFFLLAIEIAFKRRKERREKEMQVSRSALVHWRKKLEVKAKQKRTREE